ncbi:MAG: pyrimidine 5'-nucleotidase [Anaerolineaceae bacterium]
MFFETIFFDLDDTLYPSTSGLWGVLQKRIELFMTEVMGLPSEIVPSLRKELFLKHGTTLRGLEEIYHINSQDFLDFVHDVPLNNYLQPNLDLRQTLCAYPIPKVIFTNADTNHANRVISALGVDGCFDKIVDIRDIHPYCKPQREAFEKALELTGIKDPRNCVMIDDSPRNLFSAKDVGLFTIQIGVNDCPVGIDASILSLLDLPSVIPI